MRLLRREPRAVYLVRDVEEALRDGPVGALEDAFAPEDVLAQQRVDSSMSQALPDGSVRSLEHGAGRAGERVGREGERVGLEGASVGRESERVGWVGERAGGARAGVGRARVSASWNVRIVALAAVGFTALGALVLLAQQATIERPLRGGQRRAMHDAAVGGKVAEKAQRLAHHRRSHEMTRDRALRPPSRALAPRKVGSSELVAPHGRIDRLALHGRARRSPKGASRQALADRPESTRSNPPSMDGPCCVSQVPAAAEGTPASLMLRRPVEQARRPAAGSAVIQFGFER